MTKLTKGKSFKTKNSINICSLVQFKVAKLHLCFTYQNHISKSRAIQSLAFPMHILIFIKVYFMTSFPDTILNQNNCLIRF